MDPFHFAEIANRPAPGRLADAFMLDAAIHTLFQMLSLPQVGLSSVFVISFIAATWVPMGSEPAVFAVIKANGALFWPVIMTATVGNTLGGIVNYWLGYGAKQALAGKQHGRWLQWLERFGAKTMLLSWLPGVGDPLCSLGGWLRLPFWPSVLYMAIGKFLRYVAISWVLLGVPNQWWRHLGHWLP